MWLLTQGCTPAAVAEALGRDVHTIGRRIAAFAEGGPKAAAYGFFGGGAGMTGSLMGLADGGGAGFTVATLAPAR